MPQDFGRTDSQEDLQSLHTFFEFKELGPFSEGLEWHNNDDWYETRPCGFIRTVIAPHLSCYLGRSVDATYCEIGLLGPGRAKAISFLKQKNAIKYREDPPTGARTQHDTQQESRSETGPIRFEKINNDGTTRANRASCSHDFEVVSLELVDTLRFSDYKWTLGTKEHEPHRYKMPAKEFWPELDEIPDEASCFALSKKFAEIVNKKNDAQAKRNLQTNNFPRK